MFQGNWKCSTCGGAITELPFEPRSEAGLTCRTCYAKKKDAERNASPTLEGTDTSSPQPSSDIPDFDESQLASDTQDAPSLDGAVPVAPGEKQRFTGEWTCATCGGPITSLPFQPRDTSNLKCIDCFKASKG